MLYESGEDYLETILILKNKLKKVRSIDIANTLGYSKPSVSRAVKILKENGYVDVDENNCIILTEKGLNKAKKVFDRHNTIFEFLNSVLGVDKDNADKDACKIEHIISEVTFNKIKDFLKKGDN